MAVVGGDRILYPIVTMLTGSNLNTCAGARSLNADCRYCFVLVFFRNNNGGTAALTVPFLGNKTSCLSLNGINTADIVGLRCANALSILVSTYRTNELMALGGSTGCRGYDSSTVVMCRTVLNVITLRALNILITKDTCSKIVTCSINFVCNVAVVADITCIGGVTYVYASGFCNHCNVSVVSCGKYLNLSSTTSGRSTGMGN